MPSQVTNYKCPACTGPLHFTSASGMLECDYCGAHYTVEEVERLMREEEAKAAEAYANAQANGNGWDTSQLENEWGEDAENLRAYNCPSCGAELICDATTAATSCPYCNNPTVVPGQLSGILKPDYVIPFRFSKEQALSALKTHYKRPRVLVVPVLTLAKHTVSRRSRAFTFPSGSLTGSQTRTLNSRRRGRTPAAPETTR